jgi:uncharacterized membrane protein YgdD (TMEM256/DUF423 family)
LSARFWIFLGALFGGLAVAAGAVGAHALPDSAALAAPSRIYNTGQLYHAIHALALIGTGLVLLHAEGKEAGFARWPLQIAALAFTAGIICFSGGIYVQVAKGFTSSAGIVPFGGVSFLVGWAAFAIGALGLRA